MEYIVYMSYLMGTNARYLLSTLLFFDYIFGLYTEPVHTYVWVYTLWLDYSILQHNLWIIYTLRWYTRTNDIAFRENNRKYFVMSGFFDVVVFHWMHVQYGSILWADCSRTHCSRFLVLIKILIKNLSYRSTDGFDSKK